MSIEATVERIAQAVRGAGGRAMLVGGGVRDEILGFAPKDFDVEVYGLAPERVEEIVHAFGDVLSIGSAFAVLKVKTIDGVVDISLPRRETKIASGHRGFSVSADPTMTFEDAARRRDFTMNAIMKDPLTGEIVDSFHGRDDIAAKTLRVVDEHTFGDDPLRVLRAMQFVARFDLTVDDASKTVMRKMAPRLAELPRERVGAEWRKLLLSEKPSLGLALGRELGVYEVLHPEIPPLWNTPQEPEWHPEGDVWTHSLMAVDVAARTPSISPINGGAISDVNKLVVMLGTLCHDFGKPSVTHVVDGRIRSIGHEESGRAPTRSFLSALAVDETTMRKVENIVGNHLAPWKLYRTEFEGNEPATPAAIRRLAHRLFPATILELSYVAASDAMGMGPFPDPENQGKHVFRSVCPWQSWIVEKAHEVEAATGRPPDAIRGQNLLDLGFTPGPKIGELIEAANVMRDEEGVSKEEILNRIRNLESNVVK